MGTKEQMLRPGAVSGLFDYLPDTLSFAELFASPCNRATVLHEAMNVTLKLEDELCKEARHKAVDVGMSLSGWITELLKKELSKPETGKDGESLLNLVGCEDDRDFEFPRSRDQPREVDFS